MLSLAELSGSLSGLDRGHNDKSYLLFRSSWHNRTFASRWGLSSHGTYSLGKHSAHNDTDPVDSNIAPELHSCFQSSLDHPTAYTTVVEHPMKDMECMYSAIHLVEFHTRNQNLHFLKLWLDAVIEGM